MAPALAAAFSQGGILAAAAAALPAGLGVEGAGRLFAAGTPRPGPLWVFAACLIVAVWAALVAPSAGMLAVSLAFGWTLLALALVDAAAFRLPDLLTLPLIVAGLAVSFWRPQMDLIAHVAGAAAGYGVLALLAWSYQRWRSEEGLGLGDAKLLAAAGAWLGWRALPQVVLIACAGAFLWIAVRALAQGPRSWREKVPFGAPLCLAIWLVWLYGPLLDGADSP
jgi:leader peptidase (prepilin peptidase)/N-methyltransferase